MVSNTGARKCSCIYFQQNTTVLHVLCSLSFRVWCAHRCVFGFVLLLLSTAAAAARFGQGNSERRRRRKALLGLEGRECIAGGPCSVSSPSSVRRGVEEDTESVLSECKPAAKCPPPTTRATAATPPPAAGGRRSTTMSTGMANHKTKKTLI